MFKKLFKIYSIYLFKYFKVYNIALETRIGSIISKNFLITLKNIARCQLELDSCLAVSIRRTALRQIHVEQQLFQKSRNIFDFLTLMLLSGLVFLVQTTQAIITTIKKNQITQKTFFLCPQSCCILSVLQLLWTLSAFHNAKITKISSSSMFPFL